MHVRRLTCCGVFEISELCFHKSPREAMTAFVQVVLGPSHGILYNPSRFAYVMFTAAGKEKPLVYGEKFKAYIVKEGLGTVVETGVNLNPNSNNQLKVFLWTVNHPALAAWAVKYKVEVNNGPGGTGQEVQAVPSVSGTDIRDLIRAEVPQPGLPAPFQPGPRIPF